MAFESNSSKQYTVNTLYESFDVEIVDAESKYLKSRKKDEGDDDHTISTPMPGKVVRIPVKVGDQVKAGDVVIIISAMKMESEYKAGRDGVIKEVHVKEGDTIEGNQALISLEQISKNQI